MMNFSKLTVSTRMGVLVAVSALALLMSALFGLYSLRDGLHNAERKGVKNVVMTGLAIAEHFHQQQVKGVMTEREAKASAVKALSIVRFGSGDYFWITDMSGVFVMHPVKQEFVGSTKWDLQDANGRYIIREAVQAAKTGGNWVEYFWPKPGNEKAVRKFAYADGFAPWGWMLTAGIYADDVDAPFYKTAALYIGFTVFALISLLLVAVRIRISILRQLGGEPAYAAKILHSIANGDLVRSVEQTKFSSEGSLLFELAKMRDSLRDIISKTIATSKTLRNEANEVAEATGSIASLSDQQASTTSATAAAIEEMSVSINEVSELSSSSEDISAQTATMANEGAVIANDVYEITSQIAGTTQETMVKMHSLVERSKSIGNVASTIKEIADQTNLLALNAAIEAARAGETGRGFAVVADEVRKLAERTSTATLEIATTIQSIQSETIEVENAMNSIGERVQEGIAKSRDAAEKLQVIHSKAEESLRNTQQVDSAMKEQSSTMHSIAGNMESVSSMSEEVQSGISRNKTAIISVNESAENLSSHVSFFRIT